VFTVVFYCTYSCGLEYVYWNISRFAAAFKVFINRGSIILNSNAMSYCDHSPPALLIFQNITLPVMVCVYEFIYICVHFTYVYQRVCVCVCITKFIR